MPRLRTVLGEIYLRPYLKYDCHRAEMYETHACCTNFCRDSCTIFHVMSTLCYFFAKNCYYITHMLRTLENFLYYYVVQMLKMACSNRKACLSDFAYSTSAIQASVWHLVTSRASKGSSHRFVLSRY